MKFSLPKVCFALSLFAVSLSADEAGDAKIFFADYPAIAAKAKAGGAREAMVAMDGVIAKVSSAPWKDIALFKKSQLAESVDATIARLGYQTVLDRLQSGSAGIRPALKTALEEGSRRGQRRVQLAEVAAALEKYYNKRVEYPETLQVLLDKKLLAADKLRDEGGKPIEYKAMPNPAAPKILRQKYSLNVPAPKPFSEERFAVAGVAGASDNLSVTLRMAKESRAMRAGEMFGGYTVAIVSLDGVILCDNDNVVVLKGK